jgi:phage/conjugal plasmid C-4 type zinc finger TraR family protein
MDEHIYELAQASEEARVQAAIANRVQYRGESATECDSCEVEIPEARRIAVPGCRYCVDCQARAEVRK